MPAEHDRHRRAQADELAADERHPAHRLGEEHVHGALLDLLVHQAGGDEHGDDQAEAGDGDEAEVLHHAALLAEADAAQPQAGGDHQQGEHDDHREHAVADRLLERVDGDGHDLVHAVTTFMKKSSSEGASSRASATVPCQTTRPSRMMAMREHSSCTSLRMCELNMHRLAALVQALDDALHLDAADRVEARHRLVEEHELGIVDQRLGDADALQHALGVLAQVHVGGGLAGRHRRSSSLDALVARVRVERRTAARRSRGTRARRGSRRSTGSRADSRRGASPPTPRRTVPAVGLMRPKATLTVVVLPAPLGPSRPNTSLWCTTRSTPLRISTLRRRKPTATVLCRPLTSTAGLAARLRGRAGSHRLIILRDHAAATPHPCVAEAALPEPSAERAELRRPALLGVRHARRAVLRAAESAP